MGESHGTEEPHSLRGPIDRPALLTIRGVFNDEEPLASAELDDFLDPRRVEVAFADGLCDAGTARIDIQWTTRSDYSVHYTDSCDVDLRWDKHPHGGDYVRVTGPQHYHPSPDASADPNDVEESCITQSPPALVARAVGTLWRAAYHAGSLALLNAGSNPP